MNSGVVYPRRSSDECSGLRGTARGARRGVYGGGQRRGRGAAPVRGGRQCEGASTRGHGQATARHAREQYSRGRHRRRGGIHRGGRRRR
uniref:Uncharacterized protein n=1 Tax=uncultured marine virus TaxID=186617 RepID=A0A0F7L4X8_9VIRU|nr:hypothetical protein [uncultured marine virus]